MCCCYFGVFLVCVLVHQYAKPFMELAVWTGGWLHGVSTGFGHVFYNHSCLAKYILRCHMYDVFERTLQVTMPAWMSPFNRKCKNTFLRLYIHTNIMNLKC